MKTWQTLSAPHAAGWLATTDPRLKLAWLGTMSVLCVLVDSFAALALLTGVSLAVCTTLRGLGRAWLALALMLALVAWGTVLTQGLFYVAAEPTVVLQIVPEMEIGGQKLAGVALTREGMLHGLVQAFRFLATILAGVSVALSTSPERLLAALVWFRTPMSVAFMTTAAVRFLPLLVDEWLLVRQARRLRDPARRGNWRRPATWAAAVWLLAPVLAATLRRSRALATSVTSRGFDAQARRTFYPELRFAGWEQAALAALYVTLLTTAVVKTATWLGG